MKRNIYVYESESVSRSVMSGSLWVQGLQPPRLLRPRDLPGKKEHRSRLPFSFRASLGAQLVKNPPAKRETQVQSLGWGDPLEKRTATHSSILAWRIPWTVQSTGLQRIGHDWATFISLHFTSDPGIEFGSPKVAGRFFTVWAARGACVHVC